MLALGKVKVRVGTIFVVPAFLMQLDFLVSVSLPEK